MDKTQTAATARQNRVTVRYEDGDGKRLNEDLSLFGAEDSPYHINIPSFPGYWLTDASAPVKGRFPVGTRLVITLTYTALGRVELYRDGELVGKLKIKAREDDPSRIRPLQLPKLADNLNYYVHTNDRYHLVMSPNSFIPTMPAEVTQIEVLSAEAADAKSNNEAVHIVPDKKAVAPAPAAVQEPITAPVGEVVEKPVAKKQSAPDTMQIQALLARALNQQAQILATQDLTATQRLKLITHMRAFLRAIDMLKN